MLNDLWSRVVAWTGGLVTPDWAALVALIPLVMLLASLAFIVVTAAKWAGAGPSRRSPGPRAPRAPDGRPVQVAWAPPMAVAAGAFTAAFGMVAGGPWLAVGTVATLAGIGWWAVAVPARRRRAAGWRHGSSGGGGRGATGVPRG